MRVKATHQDFEPFGVAVVWKWKSQKVRSAGEHVEEREPCALPAGTQIDAAVGEDRADISPNIGNRTTVGPNSLSSGYLSKRIESRDVEICTSMAVAAACPADERWKKSGFHPRVTDEQTVAYTQKGILFRL